MFLKTPYDSITPVSVLNEANDQHCCFITILKGLFFIFFFDWPSQWMANLGYSMGAQALEHLWAMVADRRQVPHFFRFTDNKSASSLLKIDLGEKKLPAYFTRCPTAP